MNRRTKIIILCIVIAIAIIIGYSLWLWPRANIDIMNPIRSAEEDLVTSLPGLDWKPTFRHYSGYLNADDQFPVEKFAHYWFVESQSTESALEPLVLWLGSGEAGCSNMIGLLTELGPFRIEPKSLKVKPNLHAWNSRANVLFIDSPTDIGYSYSLDSSVTVAAKQNYKSLKSFLEKFPQYSKNPLYLAGRFSAGVYLPLLAEFINDDPEINLMGIAIGNGYMDMSKNDVAIFMSAFNRGIISEASSEALSRYCCDDQSINEGCHFWPPANQGCIQAMDEAAAQIFNIGVNIYNVNRPCEGDPSLRPMPLQFTRRLFGYNEAKRPTINLTVGTKVGSSTPAQDYVSFDPLCNDYYTLKRFMNQPEVRKALHIPEALDSPYEACSKTVIGIYDMNYPTRPGGMTQQVLNLLESNKKLHFMFYSGDADIACPLLGNRWFVENLGARTKSQYVPWIFKDQVAGFVVEFDRILYLTVKGAGQMVASDKPAEAQSIFELFISGSTRD